MKVYVDGVFCCELENGAKVSDIKSAVGMPCYAFARQKRYLTARQIFGWFGGKSVTRPQLAQVLQNLNINVDLTQLSYDWWDFLALGVHGTFDADVPLGQTMALGVPVNPISFCGPVDPEIKNRYTYDHAVCAREVYAFTRIGNTNLYLMSIPSTRDPLFRVSPPSNYDVDVVGMLEKMILPPPEGTLFYPDGRLQYRADTQELRAYVSEINSLGGHYVVQGVDCLSDFEGAGKYWGHDYPSAFALPSGGLVKKFRAYRAGAELLDPLPNVGAAEAIPACLADVVGRGERRGSNFGGMAECLGMDDDLTHFLATQDASTFSFKKMNCFDAGNEGHLAEVHCRQQRARLTVFAVYGNYVEIAQYGCGTDVALLKVKGCYEVLHADGPYVFGDKCPTVCVDKTPKQIASIVQRRLAQIVGENGYVEAFALPAGIVPCVPATCCVRGWPTVEMPPPMARAEAAAVLATYGFAPKYSVDAGLLTDNLLLLKTLPENQEVYPPYAGEVVQIKFCA
jgi:hypothetical protein